MQHPPYTETPSCWQVLEGGSEPKDYKPVNGQPFPFKSITYLITTCNDAPAIDAQVEI
jgi:hypothetical protein